MGAAGRDFHNFNVVYRQDPSHKVLAFTAAQIPDIDGRRYPPELSGPLYPEGLPIHAEEELEQLIRELEVEEVVFAYSDVTHEHVMHCASRAHSAGADFALLGPDSTQIVSSKPVVAICAVRTGCGKSQTTRALAGALKARGLKVAIIRHPMPYGDLAEQAVQRYAQMADMDLHKCTIEEREEYEPHIVAGHLVFAGVDYGAILEQAEREADIIIWDGGNNDFSFYAPDVMITVTDPHRAGHSHHFHPGETNLRQADIVLINKVDSAVAEQMKRVREAISDLNPTARVIEGASPITLEEPDLVAGKQVLVIEDGPTVTHGGMGYGAGLLAARQNGAGKIVDPRPQAVGSLVETFAKFPHLEQVLPAMGYSEQQVAELEATIKATPCDVVVTGTPIALSRLIHIQQPLVRAHYSLDKDATAKLDALVAEKLGL